LTLLMIAGLGAVALRTLTARYDGNVLKERLLDSTARQDTEHHSEVSGPLNYLLIGSDKRATNPGAGERSDTIMIVHITEDLDRAYLISVPRDLLVRIPAHRETGFAGGTDKINAAFQFGHGGQGGSQLLSATLTDLTGLRFDGAAIIDFSGFRKVIDLVGGVRMCVKTQVRSIHTGRIFTPGCHQMSGGQALDFARQRYDLPGGDFDRQRHQQQLLRALIDKMADRNVITNPVKTDQIIRGVGAALTLDTNGVPTEDLVLALRGLRTEELVGVQVPTHPEMIGETSYTVPDGDATGLFRSLRKAELHDWVRAHPRWVNEL